MDKAHKDYLIRVLDSVIERPQVGYVGDALTTNATQDIARVAAVFVYTHVERIKVDDEETDSL